MLSRISDLKYKEVINVCDGHRLGYVCDAEFDVETGAVRALVVPGPCRFLGLFWREEDYILPWDSITRIGEDIILTDVAGEHRRGKRARQKYL